MAYEGFEYDYSGGNISLPGQTGGTGFAEGWTDVTNGAAAADFEVSGGPYTGLATSGGHGFMGDFNRVGRNMVSGAGVGGFADYLDTNSNIGLDGTTLYLSYSIRYSDPNPFWATELHRDGAGDSARILQTGQIDASGQIKSLASGTASQLVLDATADSDVHFLVLRFDFTATGDGLKIYYDPAIDTAGEPATPTAEYLPTDGLDLSFDRISFANFNNSGGTQFLDFDEIRFGTTFNSVTAIPEASAFLALSLVGSFVAYRRQNRRRRVEE